MKSFVAVARREFAEKRIVLLAAAVLGLAPLAVVPLFAGAARHAPNMRASVAVVSTCALAAGLSLALGASVVAAERANRRLGFFLSRPISVASLWWGKLTGALALVVVSAAITASPAFVADRDLSVLRDLAGSTVAALGAALGACLLLLLLGNFVATIVKSRGGFAILDLVLVAAVGLIAWNAGARLYRVSTDPNDFARRVWIGAALMVVIALAAAGHRALARGRTDPVGAHRAQSAAAWSILGAAALSFGVYAGWVLAASPANLAAIESAYPLGSDGAVVLAGIARGARAEFLFDERTEKSIRLRDAWPIISGDGKSAAWAESEERSGPAIVRTLRLDTPGAEPLTTRISLRWPRLIFLSDDGALVGAIDGGTLTVAETSSSRSLGSVRILTDSRSSASAYFAGPGIVRIFRGRTNGSESDAFDILEYDVARHSLTKTGGTEPMRSAGVWRNAEGTRFVGVERRGEAARVTLRDTRTGAVLAVLREADVLRPVIPQFAADGRIALVTGDGRMSQLDVFSASGSLDRTVPLGAAGRIFPGGETAAGKLLVSISRTLERGVPGLVVLGIADLDRGTFERAAEGLRPIGAPWYAARPRPGSEATKLFVDRSGRLVRFDPASGDRRLLLGGP